jgi:hypothetical protein
MSIEDKVRAALREHEEIQRARDRDLVVKHTDNRPYLPIESQAAFASSMVASPRPFRSKVIARAYSRMMAKLDRMNVEAKDAAKVMKQIGGTVLPDPLTIRKEAEARGVNEKPSE